MPHISLVQWAGFLSAACSMGYFVQAGVEERCDGDHVVEATYFAMGVNVLLLTAVMWYGIMKEKSILLKMYIIIIIMAALICLFTLALESPSSSPGDCNLKLLGPVVLGVLQLVTAGVVWKCMYLMSQRRPSEENTREEAPEETNVQPTDTNKYKDDPPSYNEVVFSRSLSSPPGKTTTLSAPLSYTGPQGVPFTYGSLNSMPPAYSLAVSQAPPHDPKYGDAAALTWQSVNSLRSPDIINVFTISEPHENPRYGSLTTHV